MRRFSALARAPLTSSMASTASRCGAVHAIRGFSGISQGYRAPTQRILKSTTNTLLPRVAQSMGNRFYSSVTVECPPMGESITEGTFVSILVQPGDAVAVDDVVAQIETDKVTLDVRSPYNGSLTAFLIKEGDTVTEGLPLFTIDEGAAGKAAAAAPAAAEAPKAEAAAPTAAAPAPPAAAAPAPPKAAAPKAPEAPKAAPSATAAPSSASRFETRVPMSRLRRRVADRLKQSQNTYALLTTYNEVDMTNLIALRTEYKDAFLEKHGVKLGFMSAFVMGAASALQEFPAVNGVIDGDDIIYRDYYDISIAVGTPKGLVVPVLRNVNKMNFADIEKNIGALGKKARDGQLSIDDMSGGSFTISNGGVYGSLLSSPIINPPQSAILGMHATQQRPMAVNGEVKIRPMMYVALTYDHRLIDGREAVLFLKRIKDVVEDPKRLVLNL